MSHKSLSEGLTAALMKANTYKGDEGSAGTSKPPFTITIAREPGALGTAVSRELGQRLGWPVYDHELLDKVAQEMRAKVDLVKLIDEKPISWLEECVVNFVVQNRLSHDSYMMHLVATVRGLGQRGHCVIVGRGANFMLPAETTLRVRLVADLHDRIANIKRIESLSDKEAARWIETKHSERLEFVKRRFRKDGADPHAYDLVLNTSRLSISAAAEVIIAALQRFQAAKTVGGAPVAAAI
jgi:cytidylate kinase